MQNLLFGVDIVFPIFFTLLLGYVLKERGYLDENFVNRGSWLVFHVALPFKLFIDIYQAETGVFDLAYIGYIVLGSLAILILAIGLGHLVHRGDKSKIAAFSHCAYRSNFVYVGLPILDMLYGGSPPVEYIVLVTVFGLTFYNISSIILLSYYDSSSDAKISPLGIARSIITNPMTLGILAGLVFNVLNIPIYSGIERALNMVSNISTPMSLIVMGATLTFGSVVRDKGAIFLSALIKTVIGPLIMIPLGRALGFENPALGVAYVFFATPCAINCFIFTKEMNGDYRLALRIVTVSFLISVISLPIGIMLMTNFNLL